MARIAGAESRARAQRTWASLLFALVAVPRVASAQAVVTPNQPFCFRDHCLMQPSTYGATIAATDPAGVLATTLWQLAFATPNTNMVLSDRRFAVDPAVGARARQSGFYPVPDPGMQPTSPLAVGYYPALMDPYVAGAVPYNASIRGLALSWLNFGTYQPVMGSDPVVTCITGGTCVALTISSTQAMKAYAAGPGQALAASSNPAMAPGVPAARPVLLERDATHLLLIHRGYFGGAPPVTTGIGVRLLTLTAGLSLDFGLPNFYPIEPGNDVSPLGAVIFNNRVLIAYASVVEGSSRVFVGSFPLSVANFNPAPPPANWIEVYRAANEVAAVGLARSRDTVVLSIQTSRSLYTAPIYPNEDGTIGLPAIGNNNLLLGPPSNSVLSHTIVSGPLPVIAYDEAGSGMEATRRARGVVVGVCSRIADCQLLAGTAAMCGECANYDCRNWVRCAQDAGVLDVPLVALDVPSPLDVSNPMGLDVRDVPTSVMDGTVDATVPADSGPVTDGGAVEDAVADQPTVAADANTAQIPANFSYGGGSCSCRTGVTHAHFGRDRFALAAFAAALSAVLRRANRRAVSKG